MSDLCTDTLTKHDVAVALKNTAKGQLSYDTSESFDYDSLNVCTAQPCRCRSFYTLCRQRLPRRVWL